MGRIAIRVDASSQIGSGHVMRCLVLADALADTGRPVLFLCRALDGNLLDRIRSRGHQAVPLGPPVGASGDGSEAWDWEHDASESARVLLADGQDIEWLVVDHYGLDSRWESRLAGLARAVLVIDDLADRTHQCDVLLDQNLVAGMEDRYAGLVPATCLRLLGPEYALLRPGFADLHRAGPPSERPLRRVLSYFGAAAPAALEGMVLQALQVLPADVEVDVVGARGGVAGQSARIRFLGDSVPDFPALLGSADLAIGAGGVTSWERCCLGLPALVLAIADNQVPIAQELSRRGAIEYAGRFPGVGREVLEQALLRLADPALRLRMATTGWRLVDGAGVGRVLLALLGGRELPLRLRDAEATDEALLLEWANDADARAHAFSPARIGVEEHAAWFRRRMADRLRCRILIGEVAGVPVGQVRLERDADRWVLSYSVAASYRRMGLGLRLVEAAMAHPARGGRAVLARVKPANAASLAVFRRLGFEEGRDEEAHAFEFPGHGTMANGMD